VSDAAGNKLFLMEVETGAMQVLAGQRVGGTDDGTGTAARFWRPRGVAFAPDGRTVYVADSANHLIRSVSYPEGVVTTLAGKVRLGIGVPGVGDGAMALGWVSWSGTRVAMFSEPHDVAVSPDGLLVAIADFGSNRVRVMRVQDGSVVTLAKRWESPLFGVAMGLQFSNPRAVAFGAKGVSLLVADVYGVREVHFTDLTVETLVHTFDWTDESWYATGLATCLDGSVLVAQTSTRWEENDVAVLRNGSLTSLSLSRETCTIKGIDTVDNFMAGTSTFPGYSSVDVSPGGGAVLVSDPCRGEVATGHYEAGAVEPPLELDAVVILEFSGGGVTSGQPQTPHPKPETLNPKTQPLNPKPLTLNPKSQTLNPKPHIRSTSRGWSF